MGSMSDSLIADSSSATPTVLEPHVLPFRGSAMNPRARACNARNDTCHHPAMPNGKCRKHGGLTPTGAALPQYKAAGYSKLDKALPGYLREKHEEFVRDWPGLVDLSDALAAQWATITDLYERLPSGRLS